MKKIQIFKSGTHISSDGSKIKFTEDQLKSTVESYNKASHEAPIVIGHPKTNAPAFGWVDSLEYSDGSIWANLDQVNNDFEEMVKAGSFKKRSASFYHPDCKTNPKPGVFYLKHVGFLGAKPPAIKGLKDIAFSEDDQEIVLEFDESFLQDQSVRTIGHIFSILKKIRDYFIEEKGIDHADKIINSWDLESFQYLKESQDFNNGKKQAESNKQLEESLSYEEKNQMNFEEMKKALEKAQLERDNALSKANEYEQKTSKMEDALTVDAKSSEFEEDGKITPAQKEKFKAIALSMSKNEVQSFDFSEGKVSKSPRDLFYDFIGSLPKQVEYSEVSADEDADQDSLSYQERINAKTKEFVEKGMPIHEAAQKAVDMTKKD